jgi:hypothetical protein
MSQVTELFCKSIMLKMTSDCLQNWCFARPLTKYFLRVVRARRFSSAFSHHASLFPACLILKCRVETCSDINTIPVITMD